jgi:hypothetical protein
VNDGGYNLALLSQFDKQGFPAFDYLINGLSTPLIYIQDSYTNKCRKYKKVLDRCYCLIQSADSVVTDWNSGYRNSYIANNGTSVEAQ